jgi:hypothetical protein
MASINQHSTRATEGIKDLGHSASGAAGGMVRVNFSDHVFILFHD